MAEVKVNKGQWDALGAQEQKQIQEGLVKSGAIREGDTIVGDTSVHATQHPQWNPIQDLCKAACDVAATSGAAWCAANTAGAATALCLAAAEAARQECRNRC